MTTSPAPPSCPPAAPVIGRRPVPRRITRFTGEDWAYLGGSLVSSLALVTLVYDHILALSGTLGFLVCWYAAFVVLYGAAVSLSYPRPIVVDRLVTTAMWAAAAIVAFAVGSTVVFTFAKGAGALLHLNFFTQDAASTGAATPLSHGGILHAIVGTLIEVGIAVGISLPLGIGTAVFMSEVGGGLARVVRTIVDAMTALPEILAGLFIYVALIVGVGMSPSGLAVAIAMAVTMVPIIARACEVALRVVPNGLREASLALGGTRWRTVRKVVLPTAKAGLATGVILGIARGIGETAIPLITSGASSFLSYNPAGAPMNSLPLYIFTAVKTEEPLAIQRAFGAASVLLLLVLALFVTARALTRNRSVR
jgi:phosphate transport system permease protein